jgi:hypothetical protein
MSESMRKNLVESAKPAKNPAKSPEPTLLELLSDPEDFEGSNVTLLGIVHRDKRLPTNAFYCYRLVMICCAADATPAGVIVEWSREQIEERNMGQGEWKGDPRIRRERLSGYFGSEWEKTSPPKNHFSAVMSTTF